MVELTLIDGWLLSRSRSFGTAEFYTWFSVHGYIVVVYRSSANFCCLIGITWIQNVIVLPYTRYISLYHVGVIRTMQYCLCAAHSGSSPMFDMYNNQK